MIKFALPRLLLRFAWLALWLAGAAQAAPPSKPAYPGVWARPGAAAIFYPAAGDLRFRQSNGLPDVVLARFHLDPRGRIDGGVLETFFGGRKFRLKAFDRATRTAVLADGAVARLRRRPPATAAWAAAGAMLAPGAAPHALRAAIRLPGGALVGIAPLRADLAKTGDAAIFGHCEPVTASIARLSAAGKLKWRNIVADLGAPPPAAAIGHPEESCLFDARQRKIIGPIALYPLPNGDILASLATVQVRLDAATGMPAQVISPGETPNPDITVSTVCVDSAANYLALRAALRARLRRDDWTRYLRRLDAAAARKLVYWLMMQYFMFPNQLIPR